MIFLITLVLAYSMTKSVVIALIYVLVLLWDLFVLGLVLSSGDLIKTAKSHMKSTCRKIKCQVPTVEVEESCASYASYIL